MCGGDSIAPEKKAAADAQANLSNTQANIANQNQSVVNPFQSNLVKNGNPYTKDLLDYNQGQLARAYAPARAGLLRNLDSSGSALPSGFKTQALMDFDTGRARSFDNSVSNTLNQDMATRENAAAALNPQSYYAGASGANQSVLAAPPVQQGGFGNFLGGAFTGALNGLAQGAGTALGGMAI